MFLSPCFSQLIHNLWCHITSSNSNNLFISILVHSISSIVAVVLHWHSKTSSIACSATSFLPTWPKELLFQDVREALYSSKQVDKGDYDSLLTPLCHASSTTPAHDSSFSHISSKRKSFFQRLFCLLFWTSFRIKTQWSEEDLSLWWSCIWGKLTAQFVKTNALSNYSLTHPCFPTSYSK